MTTAWTYGRRRQQGEPRRPRRWLLRTPLDESDWAFLEGLPLFLRLGLEREGGPEVAVVHAGAVPGVPLEKQERDNLLNLRSMVGGTAPTRRLLNALALGRAWRGSEAHRVRARMRFAVLQQYPLATGLDTGCVYGRELTALEFPGRILHQAAGAPALRSRLSMLGFKNGVIVELKKQFLFRGGAPPAPRSGRGISARACMDTVTPRPSWGCADRSMAPDRLAGGILRSLRTPGRCCSGGSTITC